MWQTVLAADVSVSRQRGGVGRWEDIISDAVVYYECYTPLPSFVHTVCGWLNVHMTDLCFMGSVGVRRVDACPAAMVCSIGWCRLYKLFKNENAIFCLPCTWASHTTSPPSRHPPGTAQIQSQLSTHDTVPPQIISSFTVQWITW